MNGIYHLELLQEKIEKEHGLLLYFSNDHCSVCKVLKPRVEELLESRFPRMTSYYIDTDKSPVISGQHRVFTIPTILLFFEGNEHTRLSKNISMHQMEESISRPYNLVFEDE